MAASIVSHDYGLDSDDEMEVAAATVVILNAEEEKRLWVREWLLQRPTLGAYATLVQELSRHLLYKKASDWLKGDSLAQKNRNDFYYGWQGARRLSDSLQQLSGKYISGG